MNKLLIVEDDSFVAGLYQRTFGVAGFQTDVATSGEQAIEKLRRGRPDAVLLDLVLNDMSGLDVLQTLRGNAATWSVPVVVLSNAYMDDIMQAAWKAGADRCLNKASCSPGRVVTEVCAVLAGRMAAEALAGRTTPPRLANAGIDAAVNDSAEGATDFGSGRTSQRAGQQLRFEWIRSIQQQLDELDRLHRSWRSGRSGRPARLAEVLRVVANVAASAALAELFPLAHVARALEAPLREIQGTPARLSGSLWRTIGQAIALLPQLLTDAACGPRTLLQNALVLVVDDDPVSREILCSVLERADLRPLSLADPLVALELGRSNRFDLAFIDVVMPGMDGATLCAELRAAGVNVSTPLVLVTQLKDAETRNEATLAGATDFITKPVRPNELALKSLVHLYRARVLAQPAAAAPRRAPALRN